MPKSPGEKLEKTAAKATGTLRALLERALEARNAFDDAVASGRLSEDEAGRSRDALAGLRGCIVRLGELLAELETAPDAEKRSALFVANHDIGEALAAAMERATALRLPAEPARSRQVLVLKGKLGEWAEVQVPMDQDELAEALLSAEWRGKLSRAVTGTRARLVNLQDRGGVKELEAALERIEAAVRVEDEAELMRERANRLESAFAMRRKWIELGFFQSAEAYLAADADALGAAGRRVQALAPGPAEPAAAVLDGWRRRHKAQRKATDFALLGNVYDYAVCQNAAGPEADFPGELEALLGA
ncbi:MAG: hypothetical protein HY554_00845 [Elusimicrobia bacterium]|nr:hypothetical protein [Elusimicrobiota bacterium]